MNKNSQSQEKMHLFQGSETNMKMEFRYFSLGRHALQEGLCVLGVGIGDLVLVPEFICRDLLSAIKTVGADILFYPVNEQFAPQSLPVDGRVKAVIAVNYFGFPQPLNIFRDYCATAGVYLIEDNAHGFLSRDEKQVLLGVRGDIGILSLHKTFYFPDGAMLLVNQASLTTKLHVPLPSRKDQVPIGFTIKRILGRIQNVTGVRVRSGCEKVTRFFRFVLTGHALPVSSVESEFEIPGVPAIHGVSLTLLEKIDVAGEIKRRRALYHYFQQELSSFNIEPIFRNLPEGVCPYGYPFRADYENSAVVVDLAHRLGFDCSRWPNLPSLVEHRAPGYYRDVWWINFLC